MESETETLNHKMAVIFIIVSHISAYNYQYDTKQAVLQHKTSYTTGCSETPVVEPYLSDITSSCEEYSRIKC